MRQSPHLHMPEALSKGRLQASIDTLHKGFGSIGVEGNLMGDDFSFSRNGSVVAHIHVRPALNCSAYGIEMATAEASPLALGLTFATLMLRDYDRVWVRGTDRLKLDC